MLKKIAQMFKEMAADAEEPVSREHDMRVATAALLVHASLVDGKADLQEGERLIELLKDQFDLSAQEADDLAAAGRAEEAEAVDLYRFTRVLTDQLDPEGRAGIVELLWEIVLSDKVVDDYEANLVWRVAELLHVPSRERIMLRKQVAARLGVDI